MKISCEQFETLMHFYIDNELKPAIKAAFEAHLLNCTSCREKYNAFKNIILDLRDSYKKFINYTPPLELKHSEQQTINTYISAYADNELDLKENVKLKKIIINKPAVRKKLEDIYSLKELLKASFDKTRPEEDFSRKIIKNIYHKDTKQSNKDILYALISFIVLSVIWAVMLVSAIWV